MRFFQKLQLLKSKNSQLTLDILTNIVFYVMVVFLPIWNYPYFDDY